MEKTRDLTERLARIVFRLPNEEPMVPPADQDENDVERDARTPPEQPRSCSK